MAASFKPCLVEGCNGNAHKSAYGARSMCRSHYRRWQVHGDPTKGATGKGATLAFIRDVVLAYEGDDCLRWPFSTTHQGYAELRKDGKRHSASRYICELVNGPPPSPNHHAAHSCGKGHEACVNKRHLQWSTATANQMDRAEHGTSNRGERNHFDKLSEDQVREIRSLHNRVAQRTLAERFNVSHRTIQDIQYRNSWKWLD